MPVSKKKNAKQKSSARSAKAGASRTARKPAARSAAPKKAAHEKAAAPRAVTREQRDRGVKQAPAPPEGIVYSDVRRTALQWSLSRLR